LAPDENHSSKETDNRDKSLRGLMVALALAGAVAGSVILLAYASSDSSVPDGAASTADDVAAPPEEPVIAEEEIVDELVYNRIGYVNSTAEAKEPAYVDASAGVQQEDELPVYTGKEVEEEPSNVDTTAEVEKQAPFTEKEEEPAYTYVNNTNDSSGNSTGDDPDFNEESRDDPPSSYQDPGDDSQVPVPTKPDEQAKRVLDLLDKVIDLDNNDDKNNKGKGHKGDN